VTVLPLFPLGSVLFPGLVLPLNVFEERYRALVRDLLEIPESEPRRFGVVAIRDGYEVAPDGSGDESAGPAGSSPTAGLAGEDPAAALYPVGCVAEVATVGEREDGGFDLLVTGTTRFRVRSLDASGAYLTAVTEPLPEEPGAGVAELGELSGQVARAFRGYQRLVARLSGGNLLSAQEMPDDPAVVSYLVAAAVTLETPAKQRLLDTADTASRLRAELALVRRESAVVEQLRTLPAVTLARRAPSPN
jgi:Lon protease-like protein